MIDFIESETKKILFGCCERYSKEKKISLLDVNVALGLNENGNTYKICENQKPVKALTFNEVMGVRIDFTGYGVIAPPFIAKSILNLAEENNTDVVKTEILCFPTYNEKGKPDLLFALYEGYKCIKEIEIEELFNENNFELPTQ